jgi:hypothetical protein
MGYEYKVISLQPFSLPSDPKYTFRSVMNGWESAEESEKAINKLTERGWEYLHPIVLPYTTDGQYLCHTIVRLVFRREKLQ